MKSYRDYLNDRGVAPGPWITRVRDSDGNRDGGGAQRLRGEAMTARAACGIAGKVSA